MPSTGQIILPQYNSGGNWDEKLITPENGKVLGFDASLNPVQLSKQDELVSGTNIKTINGNSLLGSGNIVAGSDWTTVKIWQPSSGNVTIFTTLLNITLTYDQVCNLRFSFRPNSTNANTKIILNCTVHTFANFKIIDDVLSTYDAECAPGRSTIKQGTTVNRMQTFEGLLHSVYSGTNNIFLELNWGSMRGFILEYTIWH